MSVNYLTLVLIKNFNFDQNRCSSLYYTKNYHEELKGHKEKTLCASCSLWSKLKLSDRSNNNIMYANYSALVLIDNACSSSLATCALTVSITIRCC